MMETPREPDTVSTAVSPTARPDWPEFLAPPEGPGEIGRLGPYRVTEVLGRGAMGLVLRAEDTRLGRAVALKVMRPELAAVPQARERFLREARAQAAVHHDHVMPLFQVDEDRGVAFLAMPLLPGRTLADALRAEPRPPVAEVLRVGREVAEGLAAAHAAGVVHRDVKPSNVWLEGDRRRVRLFDFGLVRLADGSAPISSDGAVVGTPYYMSPEQARGGPVDPRADLFGLGVVLYQMTTGELPFTGGNLLAVVAALALHAPDPPAAKNPAVPPALSELILRLLAKDPAGRPPSAAAVAEELRRIEQGGASPPTGRRRLVWAAVGVLLVATGAALGVGLARQLGRPIAGPPSVPADNPDRRAAEALRAHRFELKVSSGPGQARKVKPDEPLPDGPFTVTEVLLGQGDPLPADFVRTTFLPAVADLRSLEVIGEVFCRLRWSDDDLARLADSPAGASLRAFQSHVPLTHRSLDALKRLPRLSEVLLVADDADDEVLRRLKELSGVRRLRLDHIGQSGKVTEAGRAAVADLPLRFLWLWQPVRFDRPFAQRVAGMKDLEEFYLVAGGPLDDVTADLADAPALKALQLTGDLTDAGLPPLRSAKRLQWLDLHGTKVTEPAVRELAEALRCPVKWKGGVIDLTAPPDKP